MKTLATIFLFILCLDVGAQIRAEKDDIKAKAEVFATTLKADTKISKIGEIAPGVRAYVHTYNGPKGAGKLVYIRYDDGKTNKLVKIIDLGPENRGKDIE